MDHQLSQQLPAAPDGSPQDADCSLSLWSAWSSCSSDCHGIRQRVRRVASFAKGNGKSCRWDAGGGWWGGLGVVGDKQQFYVMVKFWL